MSSARPLEDIVDSPSRSENESAVGVPAGAYRPADISVGSLSQTSRPGMTGGAPRSVIPSPSNMSAEYATRGATGPSVASGTLGEEPLADTEWREDMLEANRAAVDAVLEENEASLQQREAVIHRLREETRRLRAENARLKEELQANRAAIRDAEHITAEKVRAERAKQQQILLEMQQSKERAQGDMAALNAQLQAKFDDIRDLRERLQLATTREDSMKRSMNEFEEMRRERFHEDTNRIDDMREQVLRANKNAAQLEQNLGAALNEKLAMREQLDRSSKQVQQLQRKLSDTDQELTAMRSRVSAGALVESQEMRNLVEEKQQLQDELNAVHMNNVRLLRIMSESNELGRYINFNEISGEYVFCGYRLTQPENGPAGLVSDTATGGRGRNIVSGATTKTHNRQLARATANEVREVIDDENIFLRDRKTNVGPLATKQPVEALTRLQPEADYWIPHLVFAEAQKFKSVHLPNQPIEVFYEFLVEINKIWRSRMASRIEANKSRVKVQCEAKAAKVSSKKYDKDDERVDQELDGLYREVRRRFQNKSTLQLFNQYHSLAKTAMRRRIESEEREFKLGTKLNEALASRDPHARNLDGALAALIANTQSIAQFVSDKLLMIVADVRVIMRQMAPELAKNNLDSVSRVLDEFLGETYTVTQESVRSLRRCAQGAEDVRSQCVSRMYSGGRFSDPNAPSGATPDGSWVEEDLGGGVDPISGVRRHYS